MTTPTLTPAICEKKHLRYLDALRNSGITNMVGARPYLMNAFPDLTGKQAADILTHWMYTFPRATKVEA